MRPSPSNTRPVTEGTSTRVGPILDRRFPRYSEIGMHTSPLLLGPLRAWRRSRSTVEPRAHGQPERLAHGADGLRAEAVGADARDPSLLLIEAEDHLERLASPTGRKEQDDRLALEFDPLDAHGVGTSLRGPLLVPVHHLAQELGRALPGLPTADVVRVADVLPRAAVQHECDQAGHVLGVVSFDEPVDELRGRHRRRDAASPWRSRRRSRPRCSAALTAPVVVASKSAISSSVMSKTSFRTIAARS